MKDHVQLVLPPRNIPLLSWTLITAFFWTRCIHKPEDPRTSSIGICVYLSVWMTGGNVRGETKGHDTVCSPSKRIPGATGVVPYWIRRYRGSGVHAFGTFFPSPLYLDAAGMCVKVPGLGETTLLSSSGTAAGPPKLHSPSWDSFLLSTPPASHPGTFTALSGELTVLKVAI